MNNTELAEILLKSNPEGINQYSGGGGGNSLSAGADKRSALASKAQARSDKEKTFDSALRADAAHGRAQYAHDDAASLAHFERDSKTKEYHQGKSKEHAAARTRIAARLLSKK